MVIAILLGIVIGALWLIDRNFKTDASQQNLSQLSDGRLKQSMGYGQMILKNSGDAGKKAKASAAIANFETELARRSKK